MPCFFLIKERSQSHECSKLPMHQFQKKKQNKLAIRIFLFCFAIAIFIVAVSEELPGWDCFAIAEVRAKPMLLARACCLDQRRATLFSG